LNECVKEYKVPDMTYNVFGGTLNLAQSINHVSIVVEGCVS